MSVSAFDFVDEWIDRSRAELVTAMPATVTWDEDEMRRRLLEAYVAGWNRAIEEMEKHRALQPGYQRRIADWWTEMVARNQGAAVADCIQREGAQLVHLFADLVAEELGERARNTERMNP